MAEREHAQITPSESSQSILRKGRVIRRQIEKDLREFNSLKMDPHGCLIEFLQNFVVKFEKLYESHPQITDSEGYAILYDSLPEFWKNELNQVRIEIGDDEELWKYYVKIGVKWVKLHPKCIHILHFLSD